MLLTAGTLITGAELLRPGWIDVSGGRVTAVGAGAPPRPADGDLGPVTVVPGFVDTHTHGGGGGSFSVVAEADTSAAVAHPHPPPPPGHRKRRSIPAATDLRP